MGEVYRRCWLVALVALAGCGRINFGLLGDDGDGDGGAGDGALAACVATAEACNGVDDNCDNVIDDGCGCTPFSVDLGVGPVGAAYTGTGWIGVHNVGADMELVRLDLAGIELGRVTPFAGQNADAERVAWTGTDLAILHKDNLNLSLSRVAVDGAVVQPPTLIGMDATSSTTGFGHRNGELIVIWVSAIEVVYQRFDAASLAALGPPTALSDGHTRSLWRAEIASRHDGWVIAWTDYHMSGDMMTHAHMRFFDADSVPGTAVDLGPAENAFGLTATATGYAAVNTVDNELQLMTWDAVGAPTGSLVVEGSGSAQFTGESLAWTGGVLRGAWTGAFGIGSGIQAVTAIINNDGTLAGIEALSGNIQATGGSVGMREALGAAGRGAIVWSHAAGSTTPTLHLAQRCP